MQRAILLADQENFILSSFTVPLQIASGVSKLPTHQDHTQRRHVQNCPQHYKTKAHKQRKKITTELFEVYRKHLKTGVTKCKLLKFSHTKFQRNMWSYTRIQFMAPVQVRYYNELIWLETEIARFFSGSLTQNFIETCRKFYGIHDDANWTIMRQYTRKS